MPQKVYRSGLTILYDEIDSELISKHSWYVTTYKHTSYAYRHVYLGSGKRRNIRLHREIMGVLDDKFIVDHINGNGLDNRRANLRVCTKQQNNRNKSKNINSIGPKCVEFLKQCKHKKYRAYITIDNKRVHIGRFETAEEAQAAYNKKSLEVFGEFSEIYSRRGEK